MERPSNAQSGEKAVVEACVAVTREAMASVGAKPAGVGMAVPGHIQGDLVRWAPNFGETVGGVFRHFVDVDLVSPISAAIGAPVRMGNDANLAALGEYRFGCGQGNANGLVMFTLGTGVGGGVVLSPGQVDGETTGTPVVLVGGNGGGAELGHTVVLADGPLCGCGAYGCLEALVNAAAITARGRAKLEHVHEGPLMDLCGGDAGKITPRLLADAAAQEDTSALEVWRETGRYLGIGIANAINTFVPEVVAVGGQIAKVGEPLMGAAIRAARLHSVPTLFASTRIEVARQMDRAGVLGGAAYIMSYLGWG